MNPIVLYRNPLSGHAHRLSVAAGQLVTGPATARAVKVFGFPLDHARAVTVALPGFVPMARAPRA